MSDQKSPDAPELPAAFSMADFTRMLSEGIAAGIAKQTRKKVSFGEYDPKSNFHPDKAKAVKFKHRFYQNGVLIDWNTCFDAEIELLNRITHSGRYIDRKVEVAFIEDGPDTMVDIRYHNKTQDMRSDLKSEVRSLLDMLKQIVAAQEAEDQDEENDRLERATRPARRPFGDSKASREAREKAGV